MKKSTAIWLAAAAAVIIVLGTLAATPDVWARIRGWTGLIANREWIRATVQSYGWAAPLVFIGSQIAQVIAAPVPGEATGFIGGYLFGTLQGFRYSSIGLAIHKTPSLPIPTTSDREKPRSLSRRSTLMKARRFFRGLLRSPKIKNRRFQRAEPAVWILFF